MSDSTSTSIIYIKEEVDTSYTGTISCCSPSTSTNNDLNRTSSNSYSRSNSLTNIGKSTSSKNYGEPQQQQKTSRSVSPERQLCSSTTTLSTDLNSVHLNHDNNTNTKNDTQNSSEIDNKSNTAAGTSSIRDEMRRLCLVCGDVASGFHYGVASCEACKAFFKRTIQGNIEYTCPANNECEINKRRRKACQACRFQKCLLMGMLKEGVRLDRVRGGRQKYRRNPITNSYQTMQLLYQSNSTSLEDVKILEVLNTYEPEELTVHSQKLNSIKLTNKDKLIADIKQETINSTTKSHTKTTNLTRNNNNDTQDVLTMLSDLYDKELVNVIGWAKQLPGFTDLPLNDQMKLLQISWTEILTLQLIYRSLPFNGKFCFATDFWMDEIIAKDCGYITFYYHCVQIAQRLERLAPRREEYYLLKALILSNCDIYLDDQSSLRAFRDSILNSLNDVVYLQRNSAAVSHQQQLLLLLPSLRQSDSILRLFWLNIEREGIVKMKKLFVEMLEPVVR